MTLQGPISGILSDAWMNLRVQMDLHRLLFDLFSVCKVGLRVMPGVVTVTISVTFIYSHDRMWLAGLSTSRFKVPAWKSVSLYSKTVRDSWLNNESRQGLVRDAISCVVDAASSTHNLRDFVLGGLISNELSG
jgi:hypothetical protein